MMMYNTSTTMQNFMKQSDLFIPLLPFEGDLLYINVTPKASKNRLGKMVVDEHGKEWLKVYVTSAPENNQANQHVIQLIAEILCIPRTSLTIVQGHKCRKKVIQRGHQLHAKR
jgi:uncharacterized protein (TIGR00251 family)